MSKTKKLISYAGVVLLVTTALFSQKIETKDGVRLVHNEKQGKWGKKT